MYVKRFVINRGHKKTINSRDKVTVFQKISDKLLVKPIAAQSTL